MGDGKLVNVLNGNPHSTVTPAYEPGSIARPLERM